MKSPHHLLHPLSWTEKLDQEVAGIAEGLQGVSQSEPHSRVGPLGQEALGTISTQEAVLRVRGDGERQARFSVSCHTGILASSLLSFLSPSPELIELSHIYHVNTLPMLPDTKHDFSFCVNSMCL